MWSEAVRCIFRLTAWHGIALAPPDGCCPLSPLHRGLLRPWRLLSRLLRPWRLRSGLLRSERLRAASTAPAPIRPVPRTLARTTKPFRARLSGAERRFQPGSVCQQARILRQIMKRQLIMPESGAGITQPQAYCRQADMGQPA